jgi:hypothetical protein
LDGGRSAKARGEVKQFSAGAKETGLHLLVERNVRAPEAVDGLFRIPNEEQLPRYRPGGVPIRTPGVVRREQEQDLSLEWIGVLELINEEV